MESKYKFLDLGWHILHRNYTTEDGDQKLHFRWKEPLNIAEVVLEQAKLSSKGVFDGFPD